MLDAHTRTLLLDALRPPDDYALDFAVGTTFSLDLVALLTTPLGFTRFELQDSEGSDIGDTDAHILVRTIHEFADKITIFGQAGRIAAPRAPRPLLSMLEEMVIEVAAPREGCVFHPKVWALRYSAEGEPVHYRLLVLSRNLTFARCWDTVLVLDGKLQERANGIGANRSLGDFFAALPSMAVRPPLSSRTTERVEQLQREIRKVQFDRPDGIEELAFHPLGIPSLRPKPFDVRIQRSLVVAPFLTASQLAKLAQKGRGDVLVSRLDSLEKLNKKQLAPFAEVFALDPAAAIDPEKATDQQVEPFNEGAGLHAKLFVADDGWNAHVWTGSANATSAAFDGNVEFLVQMTGKKVDFGVEACLKARDGVTTFRDLLKPYSPREEGIPDDPASVALDNMLEAARTQLSVLPWRALVIETEGTLSLELSSHAIPRLPEGVTGVRIHPITLQAAMAQPLTAEAPRLIFKGITTEAISSFFTIEVVADCSGQTQACRFVVNAPLSGAPADRRETLLRSMLQDRRQVIRFLLLLLGDFDGGVAEHGNDGVSPWRGRSPFASEDDQALLEPLLRALDRDPSRLDHVERILRDLGYEHDNEALPEGIRELFLPIWQARTGSVA
jgi:hypothetical protein